MRQFSKWSLLAGIFLSSLAHLPARAEESAAAPEVAPEFSIELNRLSPSQRGCLMTFVVRNGFAAQLKTSAFEMVVFNKDGLVERMTVFDFGALPAGKTVVRQFDMPKMACDGIGRLLVNDAKSCTGQSLQSANCISALKTGTKTDVQFGS